MELPNNNMPTLDILDMEHLNPLMALNNPLMVQHISSLLIQGMVPLKHLHISIPGQLMVQVLQVFQQLFQNLLLLAQARLHFQANSNGELLLLSTSNTQELSSSKWVLEDL